MPPPKNADELLQEWKALAEQGEKHLSEPRPVEIGMALRSLGAENLTPLLDALGDPKSSPGARTLAMVSLSEVVQPEMADRLKSMCKPEQDGTMRTCATDLLSHIPGPDTAAFLKTLTNDPEKRVRIASLIGLVRNQDTDARKAMGELYHQPETNPREKVAMILTIVDSAAAGDVPWFIEALGDTSLDAKTRANVALALGRVGDATAVDALTKCTQESEPELLRKISVEALTAIQGRAKEPPRPN